MERVVVELIDKLIVELEKTKKELSEYEDTLKKKDISIEGAYLPNMDNILQVGEELQAQAHPSKYRPIGYNPMYFPYAICEYV